jgi:hypothetical protein
MKHNKHITKSVQTLGGRYFNMCGNMFIEQNIPSSEVQGYEWLQSAAKGEINILV